MKIILFDDHALFREGARHLLQQLGEEGTGGGHLPGGYRARWSA